MKYNLDLNTNFHTSNETILLIGSTHSVDFVLTRTDLTNPSRPSRTSTTSPKCHNRLGVFSSSKSIKSPTLMLDLVSCHIFLRCSSGRYWLTYRLQNTSDKCWMYLQRRLCISAGEKRPGVNIGPYSIIRKFAGVRGTSSFGLSLIIVTGLELTILSASQKNALRISYVNLDLSMSKDLTYSPYHAFIIPYGKHRER